MQWDGHADRCTDEHTDQHMDGRTEKRQTSNVKTSINLLHSDIFYNVINVLISRVMA